MNGIPDRRSLLGFALAPDGAGTEGPEDDGFRSAAQSGVAGHEVPQDQPRGIRISARCASTSISALSRHAPLGLQCHAQTGIRSTKSLIAAAFDEFEEKPIFKRVGIG